MSLSEEKIGELRLDIGAHIRWGDSIKTALLDEILRLRRNLDSAEAERNQLRANELDLAMLVRQMAYKLNKREDGKKLAADAMDYLKRRGLKGDILREEPAMTSPEYKPPFLMGPGLNIGTRACMGCGSPIPTQHPGDCPECMGKAADELARRFEEHIKAHPEEANRLIRNLKRVSKAAERALEKCEHCDKPLPKNLSIGFHTCDPADLKSRIATLKGEGGEEKLKDFIDELVPGEEDTSNE